jgi:mannose-1-phosphate guanylyltransferase
MRIGVIMAGGAGERFWPYSRRKNPKQLLRLTGEKSMLADTVERVSSLIPIERMFVVAGAHLREPILKDLPGLPEKNVLVEPMPWNTAACLSLAVGATSTMFEDAVMAVLTADHIITDNEAFLNNIDAALRFAEEHHALVTLGIPPRSPVTGYGYIEAGDMAQETSKGTIRKVARFHEKPDLEKAKEYLAKGNFFWNSGMFFWQNRIFLDTALQNAPEFAAAAEEIGMVWDSPDRPQLLKEIFNRLPRTSIDFALMEKSENIYVVEAQFPWDDIGTWTALQGMLQADEAGNIVKGKALPVDTSDCIIFNKPVYGQSDEEPLITALGVNNLVIVNTGDAILICPRDRCQDIKEIVQKLKEQGMNELT